MNDYTIKIKEITDNIHQINIEMTNATTKQELYELSKKIRFEVNRLRIILEAYFQYERENNLPVNFLHRSIYKSLKKFKTI